MKTPGVLFLTGFATLCVGASVILGNGFLISQAMATGINTAQPVFVAAQNPAFRREVIKKAGVPISRSEIAAEKETVTAPKFYSITTDNAQTAEVSEDMVSVPETVYVTTVFKALENGQTVLRQMSVQPVQEPGENPVPGEYDIVVEKKDGVELTSALVEDIAVELISKQKAIELSAEVLAESYALTEEALDSAEASAALDSTCTLFDVPVWLVRLYLMAGDEFSGEGYTAYLDAATGEPLRLMSAAISNAPSE